MTPPLFAAIWHFSKTPQHWRGRTRVKKNNQNRAAFSAFSFLDFSLDTMGGFTKWFLQNSGGAGEAQGAPGGFTATNPLCDQTWTPGPCGNSTDQTRLVLISASPGMFVHPVPDYSHRPGYKTGLQDQPDPSKFQFFIIKSPLNRRQMKEGSLTQKRWMHSGKTQLFLGTPLVFLRGKKTPSLIIF